MLHCYTSTTQLPFKIKTAITVPDHDVTVTTVCLTLSLSGVREYEFLHFSSRKRIKMTWQKVISKSL